MMHPTPWGEGPLNLFERGGTVTTMSPETEMGC